MENKNYTNLKNTYLYGHNHRKNNYFRNYRNSENHIDDPIFTGFTFSIDTNTSPLFAGNYVYSENLARVIEDKLKSLNATFMNEMEIWAKQTKSKFNNTGNETIGYGMQEIVTSEEVHYGAIDYLYMVDAKNVKNEERGLTNSEELGTLTNPTKVNDNPYDYDGYDPELDEEVEEDDLFGESLDEDTIKQHIEQFKEDVEKFKNKLIEIENDLQLLYAEQSTYSDYLNPSNFETEEARKRKSLISEYKSKLNDLIQKGVSAVKEQDMSKVSNTYDEMIILKEKAALENVVIDATMDEKDSQKWFNSVKTVSTQFDKYILYITTAYVDSDASLSDLKPVEGSQIPEALRQVNEEIEELLCEKQEIETQYNSSVTLYESWSKKLDEGFVSEYEMIENDITPPASNTHDVSIISSDRNEISDPKLPQTVKDMVEFKNDMIDITLNFPYTFLSVSGLDAAYNKHFEVRDSFLGGGDDTITIECLETLDMKTSAMFNKYFNAAYDRQFRRERLPVNLRRFNCSIFVHDIRNFREALGRLDEKFGVPRYGDIVSSYIVELALNYVSVVEFRFYDCEIVPEGTGNIFSNITNVEGGNELHTSFTFKYGNCVVNFLPFADLLKNYKPNTSPSERGLLYAADTSLGLMNDSMNGLDEPETTDYRRYWDKSELGNVSNDDYKDYIERDHTTAVDDFLRNRYSNQFMNNSVGEIQKASTELDNALNRTIMGISASTGMTPDSVADVLGVGYLNNAFHGTPEPAGTVHEIGNVHGGQNTGNNQNDLGNLPGDNGSTGMTGELGNVHNNTGNVGQAGDLGNTNGSVDFTDITTSIEGNTNGYPDMKGNTNNLGSLNQNGNSTGMTGDIGNLYGEIEPDGMTNELGDVYPDIMDDGITSEIGDMFDNPDSIGNTTDLGYSFEYKDVTENNDYIGVVDMVGKPDGITSEIGQTDMNGKVTGHTKDLGMYDMTGKSTGQTKDLGKYDMNGKEIGSTKDLGKYDLSGEPTGKTSDLGKYDLGGDSIGEQITDLGKYDLSGEPTGRTSDLGKYDLSGEPVGETLNLGKYDLSGKETGMTEKLGKYDLGGEPTGHTKNLGKYDLTGEPVGETLDLGKYDLSGEPIGVTEKLGKYDLNGKEVGITKDLGKYDLSGVPTGKTSDLGKYNLSGTETGVTDKLGKYDLSGEPTGKTDNLGQYDLTGKPTGKTSDLGKYDLSGEPTGHTKDLGKYDLSGEPTGVTKDLGKQDIDTTTQKEFDDLGNVFVN